MRKQKDPAEKFAEHMMEMIDDHFYDMANRFFALEKMSKTRPNMPLSRAIKEVLVGCKSRVQRKGK